MKIKISRPGYKSEEYELSAYVHEWFEPAENTGRLEQQDDTIDAMKTFIGRLANVLAEKKLLLVEDLKEIAFIDGDVEFIQD
jgi:hypothetical protein